MKELKIDDVAKETGLTKRTIRYYEEIGLISPPQRTVGGVRLYSGEDVERIKKLLIAREVLGFSLQELQQFVKLSDIIEEHKSKFCTSSDREQRKADLEQIDCGLREEIAMIELKLRRMEAFKQELQQLRECVRDILKQEAD
ncbi:MerR family transcriptional regulator [Paenibacillus hamazuiensis]|uniref:MerR family transcriptional regulator n=1 Tax=Paenibacillus hamazuiensis TaxID=2936508 RepID=UPI00200DA4DF